MSIPPESSGKNPRLFVSPLPAWLTAEKPGPQPAPIAPPGWLKIQPPSGVTPPAEPPGWLAKVAEIVSGGPAMPAAPEPGRAEKLPEAPAEAKPEEDMFAALRAETAKPPVAEMPDWLAARQAPEEGPAEAAAAPAPEPAQEAEIPPAFPSPAAELPDWLAQATQPEAAPEPPVEAETPAQPSMLDWLSEVPAPSQEAAPAPMPDWLMEEAPPPPAAGGEQKPAWLETAPEAETPAPVLPPAEVPDWLGALAEGAPPAPASEPAKPAEPAPVPPPAEVPDWLGGLAEAAPPAPAPEEVKPEEAAAVPPPAEVPDWLGALAEAAPPAPAPAEVKPAGPPAGGDLMDFLSGIDLGAPAPAAPAAGEDLLGLTGDLAAVPAEKTEEGAVEPAVPGELPEWLRGMETRPESAGLGAPEAALPPDALQEINDLRFEKIVGEAGTIPAPTAEKIGALKDMVGAIRPEIIFDAEHLKASQPIVGTVVTKEQSQRIVMLEELLKHKTEEVVIYGPRRRVLPVARWLVSLLLIAAVVVPVVLKFSLLAGPGSASAGPSDAKNALDKLAGNGKVVVAFDYEPDTSAELDPLALAILGGLASKPDVSVYAVSTRATGPALAERAFRQILAGADKSKQSHWLNLGYIPGGPNGISTLTIGSPAGMPSALAVNALGQPSGLSETSLIAMQPGLIVVLTGSAEDLRAWVEQAGRPTGIPILAATSAGNMPMASPYRQSGQLAALMSGVNDAVAFRAQASEKPDPVVMAVWNAQAVAGLAAALAILIGGIVYGLAAIREQQEQGS